MTCLADQDSRYDLSSVRKGSVTGECAPSIDSLLHEQLTTLPLGTSRKTCICLRKVFSLRTLLGNRPRVGTGTTRRLADLSISIVTWQAEGNFCCG